MNSFKTKRITVSGMMLAISAVLALVCAYIPFLQLPFGGGFTVASMLPIVVVAYMYGVKWGIFTSFCYAVIQIAISLTQGASGSIMPLFMPSSDDFMGYTAAVWIIFIDYFVAYTVLGFGGIFRKQHKKQDSVPDAWRYFCAFFEIYSPYNFRNDILRGVGEMVFLSRRLL